MKRAIACLVAGLALGTTATAGATIGAFWEGRGSNYLCQGISEGVSCRHTSGYRIGYTKSFVSINYRGKLVYACQLHKRPNSSPLACFDGR